LRLHCHSAVPALPVTRDALLAEKHVFCEKSLVFKPEEVHALRKLANERPKQILQVGCSGGTASIIRPRGR